MNPNIERLKLIFIAIFAVAIVGVGVWQVGWIIPQKNCEKAKKWWDGSQRVCATPILVSDVTGRVITDAKALAEAKKAIGRPEAAPKPAPKAE
ncbi:hypothetical protein [Phenylobacterium sp.]|uniref:hypothetical protein n=1 Tax=Phenylobacterium sp. TaxID=1871053 RepID=UPI003D299C16